jgi:teichuronic acid biosynthesis glycosyltransferase TuaG
MKNFVSIISPYRDAERFLPELIRSVQAQVFQSWELFLIDDGSKDSGPSIAQAAAVQDSRICAMSADPRQPGHSAGPWWPRNQGLQRAQGDWIAFLDADDLWHPLKLSLQLQANAKRAFDLCLTGYARFDHESRNCLSWRCPPSKCTYQSLLHGNYIPMLTVLARRELLSRNFQPIEHEDYLFWLDTLRDRPNIRILVIPELLAFYRIHGSNLTSRRWAMAAWAWNVYRTHGLSTNASIVALIRWSLRQLRMAMDNRHSPLQLQLTDHLLAERPRLLSPIQY